MPVLNKTILESNIKTLIAANNLNQGKVAVRMNMSQGNFNKKIRGEVQFTLEEIFNLATILKVPVESLWNEKGVPSAVDEKKDSKTPTETELRPRIPVIEKEVCKALARIFKFAYLYTSEVRHREVVYSEDINNMGQLTGQYYRKRDDSGNDPANTYLSILFPNFYALETQFDDDDEEFDYFSDLQYSGNSVESNLVINRFLKQLCDIHKIYKDGSITRDAYIHSINSTLEETLARIGQK